MTRNHTSAETGPTTGEWRLTIGEGENEPPSQKVRLNREFMQNVSLKEEDVVLLTGRQTTAATVDSSDGTLASDEIALGERVRENANVEHGETVGIRECEYVSAKFVVFAPVEADSLDNAVSDGEGSNSRKTDSTAGTSTRGIEHEVQKHLNGSVVTYDDKFDVQLDEPTTIRVAQADPVGERDVDVFSNVPPMLIDDDTEVLVRDPPDDAVLSQLVDETKSTFLQSVDRRTTLEEMSLRSTEQTFLILGVVFAAITLLANLRTGSAGTPLISVFQYSILLVPLFFFLILPILYSYWAYRQALRIVGPDLRDVRYVLTLDFNEAEFEQRLVEAHMIWSRDNNRRNNRMRKLLKRAQSSLAVAVGLLGLFLLLELLAVIGVFHYSDLPFF
ncbi:hypothetical protein [Natronoarchaeum rubrum]|uniref:hypothetical protein n=1 Tax=Natronoarchaeum rubrum TaxID=755311 RepID=UPI002113238C|nr:hypothetical protein [Natronoarchaeum rubrum]